VDGVAATLFDGGCENVDAGAPHAATTRATVASAAGRATRERAAAAS
jgi:hypothetical protein